MSKKRKPKMTAFEELNKIYLSKVRGAYRPDVVSVPLELWGRAYRDMIAYCEKEFGCRAVFASPDCSRPNFLYCNIPVVFDRA